MNLPTFWNYQPVYNKFSCFMYINHHHHHVVPLARISLTLSRHFSLSFIASGRSSGLHPVSSHSCCMYIWAGHPAFAWPYAGVHRSTSLMSSSLLLQQCPACLVHLTCIVFMMGGRWPYKKCVLTYLIQKFVTCGLFQIYKHRMMPHSLTLIWRVNVSIIFLYNFCWNNEHFLCWAILHKY